MHHLITDGWSFGVAASELATLYEALRQGLSIAAAGPADPVRRLRPLAARPARERSLVAPDRVLEAPTRRRARLWSCRRIARVRRSGVPAVLCINSVLAPELSAAVRDFARARG